MRAILAVTMLGIAGVLAAACERSATVDDSYYRLQMEQDLLNLVQVEDSYFTDNASYTTSMSQMGFFPSYGVTVTIFSASATGWSATARHFHTSSTCGVFVGTAASPVPGAVKREPACP